MERIIIKEAIVEKLTIRPAPMALSARSPSGFPTRLRTTDPSISKAQSITQRTDSINPTANTPSVTPKEVGDVEGRKVFTTKDKAVDVVITTWAKFGIPPLLEIADKLITDCSAIGFIAIADDNEQALTLNDLVTVSSGKNRLLNSF